MLGGTFLAHPPLSLAMSPNPELHAEDKMCVGSLLITPGSLGGGEGEGGMFWRPPRSSQGLIPQGASKWFMRIKNHKFLFICQPQGSGALRWCSTCGGRGQGEECGLEHQMSVNKQCSVGCSCLSFDLLEGTYPCDEHPALYEQAPAFSHLCS